MSQQHSQFAVTDEAMLKLPLLAAHQDQITIAQSPADTDCRFLLSLEQQILTLTDKTAIHQRPLTSIDLVNEWFKRTQSFRGKQEPIAKALGLHKRPFTKPVLDTTAGLGRDSIVIARLGARVVMVERELPIACLLQQALESAQAEDWFQDLATRIELIHGDASTYLSALDHYDALYCDPMFNHKSNKSASNKRLIQILQNFCRHEQDTNLPALLLEKLQPGQRLVIKRALQDDCLINLLNYQIKGKAFRFDVHYRPSSSM